MSVRLLPLVAILFLGAVLAGCVASPYGGYSEGYLGIGRHDGGAYGYPYGGYEPYYGHRDRRFHLYPVYPHHRHDRDRFRKHPRWGDAHRDRQESDRRDWDRDRDEDRDGYRDRERDHARNRDRDDRHHRRERERERHSPAPEHDRATGTMIPDRPRNPDSGEPARARPRVPEESRGTEGERAFTDTAPREQRRQSQR